MAKALKVAVRKEPWELRFARMTEMGPSADWQVPAIGLTEPTFAVTMCAVVDGPNRPFAPTAANGCFPPFLAVSAGHI